MLVSGKKISLYLQKLLVKEIKKLGKKNVPKLTVFLAKETPEQLSFVKIKQHLAKQLKVGFQLIAFGRTPTFQKFVTLIKEKSSSPETTSSIIQQPLPQELTTDTIYNYIPDIKEIEGVKKKSPFYPPIGLATLTILKYIYGKGKLTPDLFIDIAKDQTFFKKTFKNKKVVLIGRGITGGKPIGKMLTQAKINYIGLNSKTPNPENYLKNADLIITAVGKKVIDPSSLKEGVVLVNIGLRKEGNTLKGDYEENEIKKIASVYTPTPGGVGPIDIIYLYKNLIDSAKLQRK